MQEAKSGRPGSCRPSSGTGVRASEGKPLCLSSEMCVADFTFSREQKVKFKGMRSNICIVQTTFNASYVALSLIIT